jgi:UDPglucose 6-dehydrogenase
MRIAVIGTGYVGLVSGACFADRGNYVTCVDVDPNKIERLQQGEIPIHEPGLEGVISRCTSAGRLIFTTSYEQGLKDAEVVFIAVGTPPDEDGSADLKHVLAAASEIGRVMQKPLVIVNKSTVPVGTASKVQAAVSDALRLRNAQIEFHVVSNPEFLKEGAAIDDFMKPDRIVVGCDHEAAVAVMQRLYAPFCRNHDKLIVMGVRSAELTKYAANAMLATRISFMNELANLSDAVGADIEAVRRGIGSDVRIGPNFLYAGVGYGGSCFPKDVKALVRTASENGVALEVVSAVERANEKQKSVLVQKIKTHFQGDLLGKRIAVWGLAFKANTDDMREASSQVLINALTESGCTIYAYDPVAGSVAKQLYKGNEKVQIVNSAFEAIQVADALAVVTEWKEFHSPDFKKLSERLSGKPIFDGRNLYDPQEVINAGLTYYGIGRGQDARNSQLMQEF